MMHLVFQDIEGGADFDVSLRKIIFVDEDFADLVRVIGIFTVFRVVAFYEEAGIATLE